MREGALMRGAQCCRQLVRCVRTVGWVVAVSAGGSCVGGRRARVGVLWCEVSCVCCHALLCVARWRALACCACGVMHTGCLCVCVGWGWGVVSCGLAFAAQCGRGGLESALRMGDQQRVAVAMAVAAAL